MLFWLYNEVDTYKYTRDVQVSNQKAQNKVWLNVD